MRAAEFTDEQIIEAGKALIKEGKPRITGFGIHEKLGGGNAKRLKDVWDKYCMSATEVAVVATPELPREVQESFEKFLKNISSQFLAQIFDLNEKANKAADRKLTEVLQASAEQRAQNEAEIEKASAIIAAHIETNEALRADSDQKAAAIIQAQVMAQAQAVELAQMKERLSAAEQTATAERLHYQDDLAHARAEAARVRTELVHVQTSSAAEIGAVRAAAESAHQHAMEEELRALDAVKNARVALAEAQKDAASAREEAAKLAGKVEALEAQRSEILQVLASRSEPVAVETTKLKK